MKKLIALVLTLVLSLSAFSSAFAVENVFGNTESLYDGEFEEVIVPLAYNGRIAGRLPGELVTRVTGYSGNDEATLIKDVKGNGGILRAINAVECTLDENNFLAEGASVVRMSLEVTNEELFSETGVCEDAFSVMDGLCIYQNGSASVRVMANPTHEVARLHLEDGNFIVVYYEEYTTGNMRLVLNIEPFDSATSNNGGNSNEGSNSNNGPVTGPTITPEVSGPVTGPTITPEEDNPVTGPTIGGDGNDGGYISGPTI